MQIKSKLKTMTAACLITLGMASSIAAQDQTQENASQVMFVLDGSNSMWGQIDGTAKISIAKNVMTDLITDWDDNVPVGMMIYGHRKKDDCLDIETVAMPGTVNRQALIDKVQSISPRGKTPISLSLTTARAAFLLHNLGKFSKPKTSIVLVSDGLETCNGDPCAKALEWEVTDPGTDVHVIGFDLTDEESKSLQCIASNTGGKFFRANNANELKDAITSTVAVATSDGAGNDSSGQGNDSSGKPGEVEPATLLYAKLCETCERLEPLDVNWNVFKDGQQHFQGLGVVYPNDQHQFEPGKYAVGIRYKSSVVTASGEITIGEDGKQIGEINLDAGNANISAYATDDKTIAQGAHFRFFPIIDGKVQKQIAQTGAKDAQVWLPAGKYQVTAQHNQIEESTEIEIIAGKETIYEFDLRVGYLLPDVVLFEGGKINRRMFYRLLDSETGREITIANGPSGTTMVAKPGKYTLLVQHAPSESLGRADVEFPVEIKAGETVNGPFVLNVGRFEYNITSKSGRPFDGVWLERVHENGSETRIGFSSNSKHTGVAPAGTYYFTAQFDGERSKTGTFEVVPGEIRELNIEVP